MMLSETCVRRWLRDGMPKLKQQATKPVQMGKLYVIGIPEWVSNMCGISNDSIQSVELRFVNTSYATAKVSLTPTASDSNRARVETKRFALVEVD